ncbi:MAG: polysaccharide deacetylase family protein [Candidatus Cloacimonadaceae bacterium]|nr:polysaccharide deacetylase family protein [Candidatus Cloacimonadota bacterium]MDY0128107.1 polysaccharide deacetylase family protein [Candidatus Cloacimonadaceae bacterium]MCB5255628.1 polysaccharide deacetylase family protein [Candidatus Cloacimonadota bacterium]MCK9178405.1 polysaccharide deacetylase family protein [Candidatus Cloacimonadota bacterium]MCK9242676.1 polysaccharide deacetylase family protein [Candidatus Cloacimonadota bacterium]
MLFKSLSLFPLRGSHLLLYYHRVGEAGAEFYPQGMQSEELLQAVQGFQKLGFRFCSLSEAYQKAGSDRELSISLSSDDGLACNHETVLPIAKDCGIPLTLFVIGKCLDNKALAWNHKLIQIRKNSTEDQLQDALAKLGSRFCICEEGTLSQRLFSVADSKKDKLMDLLWELFCPETQTEYLQRTKPFLSAEQMRDLENNGAEFALHSHSHADFSRLSYPQMRAEIKQNQTQLSRYIHRPAPFFAFPYGRQCSADLIPKLCRDMNLKAALGFRYRICDNRRQNALWQRIPLENADVLSFEQLLLRPVARLFRAH